MMEEAKEEALEQPENFAAVQNDVMTITLYLDVPAGFAKALGALEMAKDSIKQYYGQKAMRDAQMKNRIIRPGN